MIANMFQASRAALLPRALSVEPSADVGEHRFDDGSAHYGSAPAAE